MNINPLTEPHLVVVELNCINPDLSDKSESESSGIQNYLQECFYSLLERKRTLNDARFPWVPDLFSVA